MDDNKSLNLNKRAVFGASQKKRVLVVEDDRSHRTLIDKVLTSCDFETVHADNGIDALAYIDSGHDFDLILMDWDMPKLDGVETTKAIRLRESKDASCYKPIMGFTARRSKDEREQCLAAGMDAYLPKDAFSPAWRSLLIDNLQGLVSGHFDATDFSEELPARPDLKPVPVNLDNFDMDLFEQTKMLLKDELMIAIEEYIEDASAYIREIETGIRDNDFDKIGRGSHPLKSNSKSFGLMAVCHIAERINTIAEHETDREDSMSKIEHLFSQLKKAFDYGERKMQEEARHTGF